MSILRNRKSFWFTLAGCGVLGLSVLGFQSTQPGQAAWAQSSSELLGVPVGTILPYAGSIEALPANWLPCDGRKVTDPQSPLDGSNVPDLTDDRFLMGIGATGTVGATGGANVMTTDGNHGHTGTATDRVNQRTGSPRYLDNSGNKGFRHTHTLSIRADGRHNHGGDNRPNFYAVRFIIRVR